MTLAIYIISYLNCGWHTLYTNIPDMNFEWLEQIRSMHENQIQKWTVIAIAMEWKNHALEDTTLCIPKHLEG